MTGKFVAYYRVSTTKQGINGLGMDAQKQAVANYLNGGNWKLELAKAIALCRKESTISPVTGTART
jgi:DNA invertase Pin-like site-specific DNA recombinase